MLKIEKNIYTVNQITGLIKQSIAGGLPSRLHVSGQLTNWRPHQSGHCYFALKASDTVLPCVMWNSNTKKIKFDPENGTEVILNGYVDVYPPQGKYQFYADSMTPAGRGQLQILFEQMVQKLQTEGLFDDSHKKPLPKWPMNIGVLTSKSGAAIGDICDGISQRWPCAKLFLAPAPVQGASAAGKIAKLIDSLNQQNDKLDLDILIVARGGGSMEDMWCFNEEIVVRAISKSKIPIITAIGHEIDTTIADLVADKRASTPTKAAVIAVPDIKEVLSDIGQKETRLKNTAISKVTLASQTLQIITASTIFKNPATIFQNKAQQIDQIQNNFIFLTSQIINSAKNRLNNYQLKIQQIEPHKLLKDKTVELNNITVNIKTATANLIADSWVKISAAKNKLSAMNPNRVLQRGYSITINKATNKIITTTSDVKIGSLLTTNLADGQIQSKVTSQSKP